MWRSLQFIPASSEKMMNKSAESEADAIIFDLEDSVALAEKNNARIMLQRYLDNIRDTEKHGIVVRINQMDACGEEDLRALAACSCIDAFLIPKADEDGVQTVDRFLTEMEKERSIQMGKYKLIPLIETVSAVLDARKIAAASPRIRGMLFGAEDFSTQMGIERTEEGEEIWFARNLHAMACKAAEVEAYDTPFTDIKNREGLTRDTRRGKKIGMTGKAAIHPSQAAVINEIYTPTEREIEQAKRILKAREQAREENRGAFSVDGKMVDAPIIQRAENVMKWYEAICRKADES